MAEINFEFSGRNGVIALAVVAAVLLVRIATLGESSDPKLEEAVRAELRNELGNQLGKVLDGDNVSSDPDAIEAALERSDDSNIAIHSMCVSKPLLSFSTKTDAVVRVDYELPGVERRSEYWRFDHSMLGGWRYRYGSNAVSYYLNFF